MNNDEIPIGRAKDLRNQQFGELTVLYRTFPKTRTKWKCQCSCGKLVDVFADNLVSGRTKSCGCKQKELLSEKNKIDYTGKKFNHLTVLQRLNKDNNNHYQFLCQCDCGNTVVVRGSSLTSNNTTTCGKCDLIKQDYRDSLLTLQGTKINYLTLLYPLPYNKLTSGRVIWHCQCNCGNFIDCTLTDLKANRRISCGCKKRSYGEELIEQLLTQANISYITQYKNNTCKDIRLLPFDFAIMKDNSLQYIIEFDGEQHFKPMRYNNSDERFITTKQHDQIKNQWCFDNDIPLIRIPYTKLSTLCLEDLLLETSKYIIKEEERVNAC